MKPRLTISDLSPRHQNEVMRQIGSGKPIGLARAEAVRGVPVEASKRLRQSAKRPNKTEVAFAAYLRADALRNQQPAVVLEQAVTLRIANGCRFTPDIVTVTAVYTGHEVTAYEVKGRHAWDDAIVKLKVAASLYPWISFVLVTAADRTRTTWNMEEVKP